MREVPGSIPCQGPHHTKDIMKMVQVVPLFSTEHSKVTFFILDGLYKGHQLQPYLKRSHQRLDVYKVWSRYQSTVCYIEALNVKKLTN